jgi:hypothetical protein
MAQLGSPGVQVNVIDESFYNPATPGTVPLVIVATAQDKANAAGTGIALGTTAENSNSLYLATSQKDLTDRFGVPKFEKDSSSNAIQGSELSEYGLFAAYSFLGASSSAYVLRANVDLGKLSGSALAPVGSPAADTYWVDTSATRFGMFEWNRGLQQFENKIPLVINSVNDVMSTTGGNAYKPKASVGVSGNYAIVTLRDDNQLWYKNIDNEWVKVGSKGVTTFGANDFNSLDWTSSWPTVTSKAFTTVPITSVSYTGVSQSNTSGSGINATFNITRANGSYTVAVSNQGSGYVGTNTVTILGSLLGGVDGTNNLTITVDTVAAVTGAILSISSTGTAATVSDLGMKITIGNFDRSGTPTVINYKIDGGVSGGSGGTGATPTEIATQLNALLPASVGVRVRNSRLEFIANSDVYINLEAPATGTSALAVSSATPAQVAASPLGVAEGVYNAPKIQFSDHTRVPFWNVADTVNTYPSARPSGSIWIKMTEFNLGAKWSVKNFNSDTKLFETNNVGMFTGAPAAIVSLDPLGGGTNIRLNTVFVDADPSRTDLAGFTLRYRSTVGSTVATVTVPSGFAAENETITIRETVKGSAVLNSKTFAVDGETVEEFVQAIQDAGLTNVTATWQQDISRLTLTHALGGDIVLIGDSWAELGFAETVTNVYTAASGINADFVVSNWKPLIQKNATPYVVGPSQPTDTPADGTLWYASYQNQVDIMVHDGAKWAGYNNVFQNASILVQASRPGSLGRVFGDLWIDTSDQENYGRKMYRWNNTAKTWDAIDVTDHTSQYGIIYADARWATTGASSTASTVADLMSSNYVDYDCPDPTAYPRGMLLWNTRRNGFNIKQYRKDYVNVNEINTRFSDEAQTAYYPDRWVSVSGQDLNQVAHFGRKAQRAYVVGQLKVAINTSQTILDEDNIFFNLIACPGYPELISDMVNLNNARNGTALVIGDTPLRLESNAQSLIDYGNDSANSGIDGELGLHTASDHLAVYYPSGLSTDLSGSNVVVPASHMMLRTIAISDQRSFQWFAPAGTRRGGITNATSVGYLKNGSFVPVSLNQGTRDQMAQVKINPITNIPGAGLVAFGQYTKTGINSSLDRVNVSRLVSYLRRQLGIITKPFIFEPNDKQTRSEIKNVCESLMLDLVSLRGIYDFIVICDESNNTPSVISNNQLYVDIAVEPVKAVEFIYIPLRLKNVGDIKSRQ